MVENLRHTKVYSEKSPFHPIPQLISLLEGSSREKIYACTSRVLGRHMLPLLQHHVCQHTVNPVTLLPCFLPPVSSWR